MKKLFIVAVASLAIFASCDQQNKKVEDNDNDQRIDSLEEVINKKDTDIKNLVASFNEITESFDSINIEEQELKMLRAQGERNSKAQIIRDKIQLIQQKLKDNREKIAQLQDLMDKNKIESAEMRNTIAHFEKLLNEKTSEIEELRAQLQEKDEKIAELDDAVINLKNENEEVKAQKEMTEEIAKNQDIQLNTAYYMYGTSKELKKAGVLSKGEVLQGTYNTNEFIKIDIRKVSVIPFNSKSAEILTNHPAGSYSMLKDSNGEYTLRITDASKFWSSSKYLVVKVK